MKLYLCNLPCQMVCYTDPSENSHSSQLPAQAPAPISQVPLQLQFPSYLPMLPQAQGCSPLSLLCFCCSSLQLLSCSGPLFLSHLACLPAIRFWSGTPVSSLQSCTPAIWSTSRTAPHVWSSSRATMPVFSASWSPSGVTQPICRVLQLWFPAPAFWFCFLKSQPLFPSYLFSPRFPASSPRPAFPFPSHQNKHFILIISLFPHCGGFPHLLHST